MRSGVVRWRCTMGGCGCKAYTQKGTLHKLVGEHNHAGRCGRRLPNINPTQITTTVSIPISARFIRAGKGRLLLHRGYTFRLKNNLAHGRKQWYCSSRLTSRCLADVNTEGPEGHERIVRSRYAHNHAPPNVRRFADGRYVVRTPHQSGHRAPAPLDPHHQLLQLQHALALYAATAHATATANASAAVTAAPGGPPAQTSPNALPPSAQHTNSAKPLLVDTPCKEED
ncbi:hypothetical protein HF086_014270 [Spodoptera exigua]|uniref:FLYWCH-type domain-containing protein n=1 Tax=Spodoptera exigua TaxID=7107 RepID=A0A922M7U4_SPOEX|nr:hypothetical protein HF086_014270 [Spodoptera exigua]